MSTQVEAEDDQLVKGAIEQLRSDSAPEESFVVVQHVNGMPNIVRLETQGVGFENLISTLDESQVQYALMKLQETIDMSTTIKFVYIHWIGEKVPMIKKGRYGVVHGSLKDQFFQQSHCDIETSSVDDISKEAIMKLISETSGMKSKVIENAEAQTRQRRGFTSVPTAQPSKAKGAVIPVSTQGAEVKYGPDVAEGIADVKSDETDTVWVCVGYEGNDVKKPLQVMDKGSGDVNELKECLSDDKPLYFLYRTTDIVDGHIAVKFVYIIWLGDSVKPMAKAKLSTHKGVVQDLFSGTHVTIFATARNEITQKIIDDKVQFASGTKSHVK